MNTLDTPDHFAVSSLHPSEAASPARARFPARRAAEDESDLFLAIARDINAETDLSHLLCKVSARLRPFMAFDRLFITLLEGQTLGFEATDSPKAPPFPPLIRAQCPQHPLWQVCDSGQVWSESDFAPCAFGLARAFIQVPLIIEDRAVGLLHFESAQSREWDSSHLRLARFAGEQFAGVVQAARLAREQQDHKNQLAQSNALLQATLEAAAEGICLVDDNGELASYNRRFAHLWNLEGERESELKREGQVMTHVLAQMADADEFLVKIGELFEARDASARDEIPLLDGRVFERYSAPARAADGRSFGRIWTFFDITERKQYERKLAHQAFHDALTGLPNRTLFTQHLEHALAQIGRTRGLTAVLFLDLDGFKAVNDSLGHERGDQLLREVAARLRQSLRPGDIAARFGGDEFVVLLDQVDAAEDATGVAERIADYLRLPFWLDGHEVSVTASIGIVLSALCDESAEDLLRKADVAMYRAKNNGKAHYEIFTQ